MEEKRNVFQTVVLGIFIFAIVIAVLVFASLSAGGGDEDIGPVAMWGTIDSTLIDSLIRTLNDEDSRVGNITYREIPEENFQQELVEALANGTGPDLFILEQSHLLRHWNKVQPLPYESVMSERDFKDTFIDESEIFLSEAGIRALPLSIDPLVLYWNRDIFAQAGFSQAPRFWDELFTIAERVTERDKANNVNRAAIAFGEYDNVNHAKDIISTLIMQAGGDIVARSGEGQLVARLSSVNEATDIAPTQTALRFYTEFADPVKSVYTWNRSLPNSLDAFVQGNLALYVGYASEVAEIQARNDHLNFDVAPLPQIRSGEQKRVLTFGTLYALAVPRTANNVNGGVQMAMYLTSERPSQLFSELTGIPSPRRDVLSEAPSDPLALIFRNSALISRAWLDPDPQATNSIFRRMVGDVTSGARRLSDTIQRADQEFRVLMQNL